MNKKAQHSRNDMVVMYVICLVLVVLTIGTLYEIGILGDIRSSLGESKGGIITTAAVVDVPEEVVNDTPDVTFYPEEENE
ncbi:hypothetical protein KY342_00675 [Candidatus Woesearchaeota archaeon]|nr:hypothetical protein [Candidatus Woesearchaeota archaeon]